jgi:WD40 repeat protein/formylglycine-generating enzyme required for sulfatase activity
LETLDHEQRFVAAMENAEKKTAAGDFAAALTALADARSVPGFERSPQSLELNFKIGRSCRITGLQNGWLEHTLSDHTNRLFSVSISPDGNLALSGSEYGILKLWDMASGQCIRTFEGHTYNVTSVSFSPDGKYALSGCYDNTMKLWDVASGQCIRTFEGYTGVCDVSSVSFSPDGKFALSGSEDKTMKLWDVASGQCIRTCQGHTKKVTSVSFSPDGKLALSGSHDKTLKLWDVASGQCIRTFLMHIDFVNAVSFSPDGKFALSGSDDNTLKLWAVASGQCLRTFEGHISSVNSVSFSPDGKFALSGSSDHSLKLWDAASGQCLRTFDRHTKGVNSVSFSPDGRYALSGSYDGPLKLWRLDWNYEFPGWTDWDDGAEPYLHNFLTVRNGKWNDDDFKLLINNLQNRGYGWLKPEGVKRELEKMTAVWQDSIQDLFQNQPFIEPEIGMQFVYVEPGSFQMGSNDACVFYAKPVHSVTISNGYWLGKYEVTQEEYQSITGSNPSNFKGGRKPVDSVSWDDAVSFCQKLTERERSAGRLPSGYEYRLPTEAEWEYAARGGIASKGYQYSGSDNPDSVAWYDSNSGSTTHDVGTKSPNELGIYDMSGNVWEWCLDDWHSGYAGAPSDGSRWGDGTGSSRVFRGGGWDCLADLCREAFRFGGSPGDGSGGLGLRVALASSSK